MIVSNSIDNELLYKNLKFEQEITPKFDSLQKQLDLQAKGSETYLKTELEREKLVASRKAHIKWFADNHPNAFLPDLKLQDKILTYVIQNEKMAVLMKHCNLIIL